MKPVETLNPVYVNLKTRFREHVVTDSKEPSVWASSMLTLFNSIRRAWRWINWDIVATCLGLCLLAAWILSCVCSIAGDNPVGGLVGLAMLGVFLFSESEKFKDAVLLIFGMGCLSVVGFGLLIFMVVGAFMIPFIEAPIAACVAVGLAALAFFFGG